MDDDDETTEITEIAPCRLLPIDVVILIADAIQTFFGELTNMLMQHANWRNDQKRMADQVERIVSE
jgi:hypothetical protein